MNVPRNYSISLIAAAWLAAVHFSAADAAAQAVQLPTFNFFTVNTTVSVPDQGAVFLGGVNRASAGRNERGIPGLPSRPFNNVATGRGTSAGGAWVTAQIHDMDAMDRALLDQAATNAGAASSPRIFRLPMALPKQLASNAKLESVAALRAQVAAEDVARQQEAAASLARGRQLLAESKLGVAKIYLQSAARNGTGEVRQQALAALKSIEQAKATGRVADR